MMSEAGNVMVCFRCVCPSPLAFRPSLLHLLTLTLPLPPSLPPSLPPPSPDDVHILSSAVDNAIVQVRGRKIERVRKGERERFRERKQREREREIVHRSKRERLRESNAIVARTW